MSPLDKPAWFPRFARAPIVEQDATLVALCAGKDVLDVGCVGQDRGPGTPGWLHGRIAAAARSAVGVDIVPEGVERLRAAGYDALLAGEIAAHGRDADVIVMADVIEHVDDPVGFLRHYARFLRPAGALAVTTPNPFFAAQFLRLLRGLPVSVNDEHTAWFDPRVFSEIVARAGLDLRAFYWLEDRTDLSRRGAGERRLYRLARPLYRWRREMAPAYLALLARPGEGGTGTGT